MRATLLVLACLSLLAHAQSSWEYKCGYFNIGNMTITPAASTAIQLISGGRGPLTSLRFTSSMGWVNVDYSDPDTAYSQFMLLLDLLRRDPCKH